MKGIEFYLITYSRIGKYKSIEQESAHKAP